MLEIRGAADDLRHILWAVRAELDSHAAYSLQHRDLVRSLAGTKVHEIRLVIRGMLLLHASIPNHNGRPAVGASADFIDVVRHDRKGRVESRHRERSARLEE